MFSLSVAIEVYLNKVEHRPSRLIDSLKTLVAMHKPAAVGLTVILTMCFVTNSKSAKTTWSNPERTSVTKGVFPPTAPEMVWSPR